jgi:hypothetical protein
LTGSPAGGAQPRLDGVGQLVEAAVGGVVPAGGLATAATDASLARRVAVVTAVPAASDR